MNLPERTKNSQRTSLKGLRSPFLKRLRKILNQSYARTRATPKTKTGLGFLIVFAFLWSRPASAYFFDVGLYYTQSQIATVSEISHSGSNYSITAGLDLTRRGLLVMGWTVNSTELNDGTSSTTAYKTTEMGPKLGIFLDNKKTWAVFFSYYMNTSLHFNDGVTEQIWRGTALKTEVGYTAQMTDRLFAGVYLHIYQANFSEQILGATINAVSYTKTLTYPAVQISYRWE